MTRQIRIDKSIHERMSKAANEVGMTIEQFYVRACVSFLTDNADELKKEKDRQNKFKKDK